MSNVYQPKAAMLHNQDGNWQQNLDGTWSEAVPLPLYGLKKQCQCGKSFWKELNYVKHYLKVHTDGKQYRRTPRGLEQVSDLLATDNPSQVSSHSDAPSKPHHHKEG